jgi:hypothetical protein
MNYNPDWLWVPPRYVSTACGYLFVRGYWDYPIETRGILYAPIYYSQAPPSAPSRLGIRVGQYARNEDDEGHKEVPHEQEVDRPSDGSGR